MLPIYLFRLETSSLITICGCLFSGVRNKTPWCGRLLGRGRLIKICEIIGTVAY